jgi:hypothetical protein
MWKRLVMVAAMAAAITPLAAGTANASSTNFIYWGGSAAGEGKFVSYGEHFYACDIKSDGYGVRVDWYVGQSTNSGSVYDTGGNDGTCGSQNASITEGRDVFYRICLLQNGSAFTCTGYFHDTA